MPKYVGQFVLKEQPMNWGRAFVTGAMSALLMMSFVDVFCLTGVTPFSFELFLGSMITGVDYGHYNWTIGFFANLLLGGLFGFFYAYCFEFVFYKSNPQTGLKVGLGHMAIAAFILFPFISAIHEFLQTRLYPHFGFFGSGLGAATPVFLIVAHLLFGSCMGLFYGAVHTARVRARYFEPGLSGAREDPDCISQEEDMEDRTFIAV